MKIEKINYETGDYTYGCETCNYGSSYIINLTIETEKCIIKFECDTMYDYLSESDLMKFFSKDFDNEQVLINQFKEMLNSLSNSLIIDLNNLKITINYKF